jgi:hypothetical protein
LNAYNVGAEMNGHNALMNIKSKYFAFFDGDDKWCDKRKLQLQVEALELNPDCYMCGHNTIMHDISGKAEDGLFVGCVIDYKIKEKYSINEPFRVHPSSRLYRNIIDLKSLPTVMVYDTAMYLLYMSKGPLYYIDRVMSVYNITGQGIMSGKCRFDQAILALKVAYGKNLYFDFKYDDMLSPPSKWLGSLKILFGKRVGWTIYFKGKILWLEVSRNFFGLSKH